LTKNPERRFQIEIPAYLQMTLQFVLNA